MKAESGRLLDDVVNDLLEAGGEGATAYLQHWWLCDTVDALVSARHRAGLTQADVAERMGTTQSAIARLERDRDGGISLRRYVAYCVACGVLPDVMQMAAVEARRLAALKPTLTMPEPAAPADDAGAP